MSDLKPLGEKAPLNLLPAAPLRAISSAMEHGSVKYNPWNYTDTSQAQARIDEQLAAMFRHAFKVSDPTESDYDDESGLHHLTHVGACVLILLQKLGIDYEMSWFVRYPDLCQAWKDAEGPEAKAAALHAIQERAAADEAAARYVPQPGPQESFFRGSVVSPLAPKESFNVEDDFAYRLYGPEETMPHYDTMNPVTEVPLQQDIRAALGSEDDAWVQDAELYEYGGRYWAVDGREVWSVKVDEVPRAPARTSDELPLSPTVAEMEGRVFGTPDWIEMEARDSSPPVRLPRSSLEAMIEKHKAEEAELRADWPDDMVEGYMVGRPVDVRPLTEGEIKEAASMGIVTSYLMRARCRHYWRTEKGIKLPEDYTLYIRSDVFTIFSPDQPDVGHHVTKEHIEGPEWDVIYCERKACDWAGLRKELPEITTTGSFNQAYICPACGRQFERVLPTPPFEARNNYFGCGGSEPICDDQGET